MTYPKQLSIMRVAVLMIVSAGLLFSQTAPTQPSQAATGSKNPTLKQATAGSGDDVVISPWLRKQAAATSRTVLPQIVPITPLGVIDGVDLRPYMAVVHDRIAHVWPIYAPFGVPELKKRSEVKVEFDIDSNGHVANMRTTQSSGYQTLDDAVRNAIVNAAPFPSLPSEFKRDHLSTHMLFLYPGETQPAKVQAKSKP